MQTAKALARLRGCKGSPGPSLVAYVISTIISCAGSNKKALIRLSVIQPLNQSTSPKVVGSTTAYFDMIVYVYY